MARTTLATETIDRDGIDPTYSSANADGEEVANSGRMFIHVMNGSGASIDVTIQTPGTVDGLTISDKVVAIAAGEDAMIGPFPPAIYNRDPGETDTVYVDFSAVTSVTIAALVLSSS